MGDAVPATPAEFAPLVVKHLHEHFGPAALDVMAVTDVAEEAGEFVGAWRRLAGLARRNGSPEELAAEAADVLLSIYIAAEVLEIDLEQAWREGNDGGG
jgi:NTP pyrophosphatase (non-canonical NTP hydrolase)